MTLYQKHRPTKISDLKGQPDAVAQLKDMHKRDTFPHAILLTGDSGCGKTTIARILRTRLKCSAHDFVEKNAAEVRGIDAIRDIAGRMGLSPMGGESRIYLLDEAQQLTKDAQSALLKLLEDTPAHVYFLLATTDPNKLLPTIRTRCTTIAVRPLPLPAMRELLFEVAEKEGVPDPDPKLLDKIAEIAQGSARKGLVLLEQVLFIQGADAEEIERQQYSILGKADLEHQAFDVAKLIVNGAAWAQVAIKLRALKDEDPEGMRRMMLAFFTTCVLNNGKDLKRCGTILGIFAAQNTYDTGWPGFVNACYKASEVK
jgi:DNA polymerase III gamma/tau subunit